MERFGNRASSRSSTRSAWLFCHRILGFTLISTRLSSWSISLPLKGFRQGLLATAFVSDVEAVATRIAILVHGQLIANDVPEALLALVSGKVWEVVVPSAELPAFRLKHRI